MEVKLTATFHRTITIQVDDEEEKTAIAAQIKLSCEVDGVDQINSFHDLRINGETASDQGMDGLNQPKKFVTITEAAMLAQQAFNAMQGGSELNFDEIVTTRPTNQTSQKADIVSVTVRISYWTLPLGRLLIEDRSCHVSRTRDSACREETCEKAGARSQLHR